jgi:hypothetical protein
MEALEMVGRQTVTSVHFLFPMCLCQQYLSSLLRYKVLDRRRALRDATAVVVVSSIWHRKLLYHFISHALSSTSIFQLFVDVGYYGPETWKSGSVIRNVTTS